MTSVGVHGIVSLINYFAKVMMYCNGLKVRNRNNNKAREPETTCRAGTVLESKPPWLGSVTSRHHAELNVETVWGISRTIEIICGGNGDPMIGSCLMSDVEVRGFSASLKRIATAQS